MALRQTVSATIIGLLVLWILVLIVGNVLFITNTQAGEMLLNSDVGLGVDVPQSQKGKGMGTVEVEDVVEDEFVVDIDDIDEDDPIHVLLYEPDGLWNTAMWSGWAGNDPKKAILGWAAEGLTVHKQCDVPCVVTRDQASLRKADVIVMEAPNHKLFGHGNRPFPWPKREDMKRPDTPMLNFYFGPDVLDSEYKVKPECRAKFDKTIAPHNTDSGDVLPISMSCDWNEGLGKDGIGSYLPKVYKHRPMSSRKGRMLYLRNHGHAGEYNDYVNKLIFEIDKRRGVDRSSDEYMVYNDDNQVKKTIQSGALHMKDRVAEHGKYAFSLVVEYIQEDDWVEMPFTQALAGGAVPVYIGAPNIAEYAPSPDSYIDLRKDWMDKGKAAEEFLDYIEHMSEREYEKFFKWKKDKKVSATFKKHLSHCVYASECRICKYGAQARKRAKIEKGKTKRN